MVKEKSGRAQKEEEILKFWEENKIFDKTLEKEAPKGEFVFYEGPPTANGMPGIHHLESRSFKDAIPRYKTMRGYHVRRRAGWDTHGLPVEIEVEKELGFTGKKDIEEYGIEEFNKKCRESVMKYIDVWERFTERIGYWLDREKAYFTFDASYMETLWYIIKKVDDRGLLYKDYKVLPWCPRCGTALSSHEVADGYKKIKDLAVTAKFELAIEPGTYFLAWTTTPWTLPGNVGLAVGKNLKYLKVESQGEKFIVSKDLADEVLEDKKYKVLSEFKGKDLVGKEYKPPYPYLKNLLPDEEKNKLEKAYKVYEADFVTTEEGTGIVHTAVMYGQDDFVLGTEVGLPKHHLVTEDGRFVSGTDFLEDRFVRDEDLAVDIIKDLAHRKLLFSKGKHEHTYPHCWRCKTPLIYYARDSWYIEMSKLRDKLVKENSKINWEPEHIRDGRFGEWLREVKDWAISRERYWGTPMPIWKCEECDEMKVIGSIEDLKKTVKKSGNKYFVMRHGESDANLEGHTVSIDPDYKDALTPKGKTQVEESADKLKKDNFDLIITSPFVRTRESAEVAAEILGLNNEAIITDSRLGEWVVGKGWQGKPWTEVHKERRKLNDSFTEALPGGESLLDVRKRCLEFMYDIDSQYKNKNILIVAHLGIVKTLLTGVDHPEERFLIESLGNAEFKEVIFSRLPHDDKYMLDLHRPYIDEVKLSCECGGETERVKEVMDVWFDSGAMPFAQDHYPFEGGEWIEGPGYPADYISEAIDQTRGWFYTLHAVGNLMEKGRAYKNVICLGHLLDAEGKKMSKSIGNIVDPWEQIDKFGVDIIRFWMYTVNQPGESKNYDEKTVEEMNRKVIGLLSNIIRFYKMYSEGGCDKAEKPKSKNVLDKWILSKLNELITNSTEWLDNYKLLEPGRAIREFIDDFSTWYIRRSRDRFKAGDDEDSVAARQTTRYVTLELSKILAPFMPFFAEEVYREMKGQMESVHLEDWPEGVEVNDAVLSDMKTTRLIVEMALAERSSYGIKVRQPLGSVKVSANFLVDDEYVSIIRDEINVKEVIFDESIGNNNVELNTEITPELKREGQAREFIRGLQKMRKEEGLSPEDSISIEVSTDDGGKKIIEEFKSDIKETTNLRKIGFKDSISGQEIDADGTIFTVRII